MWSRQRSFTNPSKLICPVNTGAKEAEGGRTERKKFYASLEPFQKVVIFVSYLNKPIPAPFHSLLLKHTELKIMIRHRVTFWSFSLQVKQVPTKIC